MHHTSNTSSTLLKKKNTVHRSLTETTGYIPSVRIMFMPSERPDLPIALSTLSWAQPHLAIIVANLQVQGTHLCPYHIQGIIFLHGNNTVGETLYWYGSLVQSGSGCDGRLFIACGLTRPVIIFSVSSPVLRKDSKCPGKTLVIYVWELNYHRLQSLAVSSIQCKNSVPKIP